MAIKIGDLFIDDNNRKFVCSLIKEIGTCRRPYFLVRLEVDTPYTMFCSIYDIGVNFKSVEKFD